MQSRGADQTEQVALACTWGLNCLLKPIQRSCGRWWASGDNCRRFGTFPAYLVEAYGFNCPCFCAGCCDEYYGVLVSNKIINDILKDMRERRGTWHMYPSANLDFWYLWRILKLTDQDDPMLVRKLFCSWIKQKKYFFLILSLTNLINRQSENDVWYMDCSKIDVPQHQFLF